MLLQNIIILLILFLLLKIFKNVRTSKLLNKELKVIQHKKDKKNPLNKKCIPLRKKHFKNGTAKEIGKKLKNICLMEMGAGLAANQIGINRRIFVAKINNRLTTICNPIILDKKGSIHSYEGCLSLKRKGSFKIKRSKEITVKYQDIKGKFIKLQLKGFSAIVFQHEFDHLEGKTILHK